MSHALTCSPPRDANQTTLFQMDLQRKFYFSKCNLTCSPPRDANQTTLFQWDLQEKLILLTVI